MKIKKLLFLIMLIVLIIPINVYAGGGSDNSDKTILTTCNYDKATYIQKAGNDAETYGKVKLVIYTDESAEITWFDGTNYTDYNNIQLYQNEKEFSTTPTTKAGASSAYKAYKDNGNNCPYLRVDRQQGFNITGFVAESAFCDNDRYLCSSATKEAINSNSSSSEEITTNKTTLTSGNCSKTLDANTIKGVPAMDYHFNMYSDNKIELCVQMYGNSMPACNRISMSLVDKTDDEGLALAVSTTSGSNGQAYTVGITGSQIGEIFKQNSSQVNNNTFTCPAIVYTVETHGIAAGMYQLTTDRKEAEEYGYLQETNEGSNFNEDGTEDTSYTPGGGYTSSGKTNTGSSIGSIAVIECSMIRGTKTYKWLQKVFNFIKIIAPILVLGLGTLDFVKAIFSGEEDLVNKAGKKFIKRVIAACAIFLLPILIDWILAFADTIGNDPTCGLG